MHMPNSPSMSPPSLFTSSSASERRPLSSPRTPPPHPPPVIIDAIPGGAQTPVRGRRYPSALSKDGDRGSNDRVPLHRRGTSKTYERLEDLLREAGYKETRIVTPQKPDANSSGGSSVMRFLSGLVGGGDDAWSTPPSPSRPPSDQSSFDSPAPRGRQQRDELSHGHHYPRHHGHHHPHFHNTDHLRHTPDNASEYSSIDGQKRPVYLRLPPEHSLRSKPSLPTYAEASPARAYLRHMASAPHIARPSSSVSSAQHSVSSRRRLADPPLPSTWLETVARAMLGLPGARVGTPAAVRAMEDAETVSPSTSGESTVRALDSRGRMATVAATGRGRQHLTRPALLLTRAAPAAPDVVALRVVCRSAPASRASSVVRWERDRSIRGKGKGKEREPRDRRRTKAQGPSLTGRVEGDVWDGSRQAEEEAEEEEEEEEEGEVDLAKLLVSPKRQMSIQSLRRHLGDGERLTARRLGSGSIQRHRRGLPPEWGPSEEDGE